MKKVASILLSAAMLLSTAACSAGGTDSKASDSTTDGENESKDITFSIFIDHSWFWHDKWGEDPVSQEITKRTGVSLDITRAADDQQLGILISGGDLPDLVYTSTQATMTLLSDPNVCYSYNELVEKTGVDIHATEDVIRNNTAKDGNYYALLNAFTSQEDFSNGKAIAGGTKTIAYRTDIYEAIGSPELNTLEDLENALLACKEQFPDVIPLLNDSTCLWYFAEQLGVNGSYQVGYDEDGNPCHFLHEEGIEEYFELLNRFAREGLISAEAQTYNFDKYSEVRNSGGAFMQLRTSDEATVANNAAKQAGTDYRWKLLTNDLGGEDTIALVNTNVGWSGTFITKNCSDPERAIEFMSWCRSEEGRKLTAWGIEGKDWEYNDEGLTVTTEEYRQAVSEGKEKQKDFGIGVWIFGDQGDENAFIDHAATDQDSIDRITRLQNAAKTTRVMSELNCVIPTEGDELTIFTNINNMCTSEMLKVIFAESDEEYQRALDSMYQQAEQLGLSELEEWMRKTYEEHQK